MALPPSLVSAALLALLILAPAAFFISARKIWLAWYDRPYSPDANPGLFRVDLVFIIAFSLALIVAIPSTRTGSGISGSTMLVNATILGWISGQTASMRVLKRQPLPQECARRSDGRGWVLFGMISWCLGLAYALWALSVMSR